jgi:[glutamine synthetase] adenylyltransferase / [glutamine synthetase]-adenylyl-L-tyrosine phosphorylase
MVSTRIEDPYDAIVSALLSETQAEALLAPVGFADWRAAQRCLQRMAVAQEERQALAALLPNLLGALAETAGPDRVLVDLDRLVHRVAEPVALWAALHTDPGLMHELVTLFAGSQFLTEILLREPEHLWGLRQCRSLPNLKDRERVYAEAEAAVEPWGPYETQAGSLPAIEALRRYQHSEYLRVGTCDLLGLLDVPSVTTQLSYLADGLVRLCLKIASATSGRPPDGFVVIGLGKLGGEELNYSSDIDLLFLAEADAASYIHLGEQLIDALARVTAEGFLYRVDMRLRPWGHTGALVSSLAGYMR